MEIYGVGTDIVQIDRIESMWHKHGEQFIKKILSNHELEMFAKQKTKQAAFIAKRFAAKEAVAKALGTGFRDDVIITQIGVETDQLGKPSIKFYGKTKEFIDSMGGLDIMISLSDETEYCVAFVIILKK